jgi:hypothetical protein
MNIPITLPLMIGPHIVAEIDCQLEIRVSGQAPYRTWELASIDTGDVVLDRSGPGDMDRDSRAVGWAIIQSAHAYWAKHRERLMWDNALVDDEDEQQAA